MNKKTEKVKTVKPCKSQNCGKNREKTSKRNDHHQHQQKSIYSIFCFDALLQEHAVKIKVCHIQWKTNVTHSKITKRNNNLNVSTFYVCIKQEEEMSNILN